MAEFNINVDYHDDNGRQSVHFDDNEAVIEYVVVQWNQYKWVQEYSGHQEVTKFAQWLPRSMSELIGALDTNNIYEGRFLQVLEKLNEIFDDGLLPVKGTIRQKHVDYIRRSFDDITAIGALAYYMGKSDMVRGTSCFRGATLAVIHENASGIDVAKMIDDSKIEYNSLYNSMKDSIGTAQNLKKAYEEALALRAPVDYWNKKALAHKKASSEYRSLIINQGWKYGVGLIAFLMALIWFTHAIIAPKDFAGYIGPATLGILVASVALWVARICVRLYMSEHHLYIDAEERAVMVQTYLSLMKDEALEKDDRALVLAPLFRSSSDGIIKDDGAPDSSLAAIISKALSK